jgi:single-strand DNA-binding protein
MSTSYEAVGSICAIYDTQQVTDTFKKREFALEIPDGNYPQFVKFQVTQDKTVMLDNYQIGQQVRVLFNLRGREYTRKNDGIKDYWLNLDAWRIEAVDQGGSGGGADYTQISPAQTSGGGGADDFDDVPF